MCNMLNKYGLGKKVVQAEHSHAKMNCISESFLSTVCMAETGSFQPRVFDQEEYLSETQLEVKEMCTK